MKTFSSHAITDITDDSFIAFSNLLIDTPAKIFNMNPTPFLIKEV